MVLKNQLVVSLKIFFPYTLPRSDEIDGYWLWLGIQKMRQKSWLVADCRYWLEQMPRLGLDPDVLSFNAVIDACARAGEVDRAEDDHWNHSRVTQ